ncbi:hypothetical protein STCU_08211 [Strigomonas culicis]|uniref:Generative cell specific-1/HAP2 domain-containing protein n=1 Tax=Strigomonas culicis TaxID=28005 RepID=S9VHF0_9TRYP|nr:hypothetical protein STCU_08211 [Strigomonas culicis]|eukprot:EPY22600.1 hypothetical protein STCU_08211 [Strigomonas culicis]
MPNRHASFFAEGEHGCLSHGCYPSAGYYFSSRFLVRKAVSLLAICFLLSFIPVGEASLIASSSIQRCTNTGDEPIACSKKMIVTLTVDGGQAAGTEEIAYVNTATDTTQSGSTVEFEPVVLTLSRSTVLYRYPVYYRQNYNAKPYEEDISGTLLNRCNAELSASKATCGVAYNGSTLIPYSQGFCCDCSVCASLGLCKASSRANQCNILSAYTSAACLRFGTRWYAGYTIGTYSTWYTINITVSSNVTSSGSSVVQQKAVLSLSPDQVGDSSTTYGILARLIGDFNPTEQALDLTTKMLFVPVLPTNDARVKAGVSEWMIISTSLVTLDGRDCDKIGVSYEAFASQGNACYLDPGSCLNSQLEDYRTTDQTSIANGGRGSYMATSLGDFALKRFTSNTTGAVSPYIAYTITSPAATMITLTLSADDLQYIVSVASGKIVSAYLNKDVLAASTTDGILYVTVQSTGSIVSRFTVGVQCTDTIFPITAQVASIAARATQQFQFNVFAQDINQNGEATCTVTLRDSQESVVDTYNVTFEVSAVVYTNGTQGGGSDNTATSVSSSSTSGCSRCNFLNFSCAFSNWCIKMIVANVAFVLGGIILLVLLIRFRKLLCCCCSGGGGGGKSHRRRSSSSDHGTPARRRKQNTGADEDKEGGNELVYSLMASIRQLQMQHSMAAAPPPPPAITYYTDPTSDSVDSPPRWPEQQQLLPQARGNYNQYYDRRYGVNDYQVSASRSPSPPLSIVMDRTGMEWGHQPYGASPHASMRMPPSPQRSLRMSRGYPY